MRVVCCGLLALTLLGSEAAWAAGQAPAGAAAATRAQATLRQADANRDGRLQELEFVALSLRPLSNAGGLIPDADRHATPGQLLPESFRVQAKRRMDAKHPQALRIQGVFHRADANRDGALDLAELQALEALAEREGRLPPRR